MKKDLLQRFIKKYHLNGINNEAIWDINDCSLKVTAMPRNGSVIASVKWEEFYGFPNTQIGVSDARKMLKYLNAIPSKDVSMDVVKDASNDVIAMKFSGRGMTAQLITSPLLTTAGSPVMERFQGDNVIIVLDNEFKNWFFKTFTAIGSDESLFTILVSPGTHKLEAVLGYHESFSSNSSSCFPNSLGTLKSSLNFSALSLKRVLKANPEFKAPILKLSDSGPASISFSGNDLNAQYILTPIDA